MIIVRSPMRITLGGGGTDLPSYYRKHTGALVAAAIDKYIYVAVNKPFTNEYIVKYSAFEKVKNLDRIKNPIFRECLRETGFYNEFVEIASLTDIPSGTGLGSSGSLTTALLKALYTYKGQPISAGTLAKQACKVEIDILETPSGKQDQYIAAVGGITAFEFQPDERVEIVPLDLPAKVLQDLENNLMLFFTGYSRASSLILKTQDDKSKGGDREMTRWLNYIKRLGLESKEALLRGDLVKFGELMNVHWESKKKRSDSMTNETIEHLYSIGLKNGAIGGKLVGAGGGGYLMFYAKEKERLRRAMELEGLEELKFKFDFDGTTVIAQ